VAGFKSDYFSNALLQLIFHGTGITGLASNASSGALGDLYISLHTANPTSGGTQHSSECNYGGYARVAVPRDSSGFHVSTDMVNFINEIDFPACTDGTTETATWFGVGTDASGSTDLLWAGPISPVIPISSGFTAPALAANAVFLTES
jgi:hypothetical protein